MSVFGSGDTYSQELNSSYEKDKIADKKFLEEQKKKALLKDRVRGELIFKIASSYYQVEEDEYFEQHPELLRRNYIWPLEVERAHAAERQARYDRSIARATSDLEDGAAAFGGGGQAKDPLPKNTSSASKATITSSISKNPKKVTGSGGKQRKSTKQRKSRNQRKRKSTKQRRSMKHRK